MALKYYFIYCVLFLVVIAVAYEYYLIRKIQGDYKQKFLTSQEVARRLYLQVLKREPDAKALAYWQGELERGASPQDIINQLKNTDEYKQQRTQK